VAVREVYTEALAARGFVPDEAQLKAVEALERCEQGWIDFYAAKKTNPFARLLGGGNRVALPRGVYMYGGVGRGKSFLMDCFFNSVPVKRKTRLHFHEFMREVHRELADLRGTVNPLQEMGKRIAKRHRLICFDEFHVADVTDAMILHRLLQSLNEHRVGMVFTSNFHPDGLYPNGLNRDSILPAIEMLKAQYDILNVDAGTDYRQKALADTARYIVPAGPEADAKMDALFTRLAEMRDESPVLHIEHRELKARRRAGGVVWFSFQELCAGPRSQNDYLELASCFHTLMLSDVPQMPPRLASEARRFTWLVDVLYDRRVKLILSAQVPAEALYLEGPLAHEFPRTVSRLHEMQSTQFLAMARRDVDTSNT
jgi:cell division protein ZapE